MQVKKAGFVNKFKARNRGIELHSQLKAEDDYGSKEETYSGQSPLLEDYQ